MSEFIFSIVSFTLILAALFIATLRRNSIILKGGSFLIPVLFTLLGSFYFSKLINLAAININLSVFVHYMPLAIPIVILGIIGNFYLYHSERRLEKYRTNFHEILAAIEDYIIVFGVDGEIYNVNDAVIKKLGYGKNEVLNKNFFEIHVDVETDNDNNNMIRDMISKLPVSMNSFLNVYVMNSDGRKIMVEMKVFKGTWNDREAYYSVARDISERIIWEERLRQTEKLQAIGQLAGGVAHDFNNQLTGVIGFSEILSKKLQGNDELQYYANQILNIGHRASNVTAQLLAFARKGKFITEQVDIHSLVNGVMDFLKYTIDKKIKIKRYLEAFRPYTLGNISQIQDSILNIALNARDAMPDGGELIFRTSIVYINREECEEHFIDMNEGHYVLLSISDTGTGMDKETQQRIFDPFFSTKEPGKGTGMGLAAVYGTIKNHKGGLSVESKPGIGTTFKLYFPLETGGEDRSYSDISEDSVTVKEKRMGKILLIDDEEIIHSVVKSALADSGMELDSYLNPVEAIDFYTKNYMNTDLVLLDMIMPEMGGLDVFKELKRINPSVQVIVVSGYSLNDDAQSILDEGGMGFLQKPFTILELMDMITIFIN